jgi:GntR family transcriptional repressor for pyruvate dehydrogenase complex
VTGVTADSDQVIFARVDRQPRLSDKVASLMLDTIIARELKPGDRLPSERELGEQFGVSRTVVREAVRSLVAKGVIESRSGSGLRVAPVSPTAVSESMGLYLRGGTVGFPKVHEVRAMLEIQMAGVAAERRTERDTAKLTETCERMKLTLDDYEAAAALDVQFHRQIAVATQNELYLVLLDSIGQALIAIREDNLSVPGAIEQTLEYHARILDRIVASDAAGARDAMKAHLDQVRDVWEKRTHDRDGGLKA